MGTLLALALVLPGQANHGAGMEALAIDMDVAGNSATALGPRQDCLTLAPGGDALVDVTATNIPPANSMTGFAYKLSYSSAAFTITSQDPNYLLAANADSLLANTSDPLPDDDLNDDWNSTVMDTGAGTPESGSGVLARISIHVDSSAALGIYFLTLNNHGHVGPDSLTAAPDSTFNASIAIGVPCDTDGDGWNDAAELVIGTSPDLNCGAAGWPAELVAESAETSTLNIADLASFIAPVRRLDTSVGHPDFDRRWDLKPGSSFGEDINVEDISALVSGSSGFPPMFGGQKALGLSCAVPAPTVSEKVTLPVPAVSPSVWVSASVPSSVSANWIVPRPAPVKITIACSPVRNSAICDTDKPTARSKPNSMKRRRNETMAYTKKPNTVNAAAAKKPTDNNPNTP